MWAFERKNAGESPDEGKDKVGGKKIYSQLRWNDRCHFLYSKKSVVYRTLSSSLEGGR